MKKIFLTLGLILVPALVAAQGYGAQGVRLVAALPATCSVGQVVFNTGSPIGLHQCTATDTWAQLASGGGSGDVTGPASTIDNELVLWNGTSGDVIKRATGTGLVLSTSGVASTYAGVTCTNQFLRILNASGAGTCASVGSADITDGVVALADMANLAQDQFIGRTTASTGVPETATITAAARTVIDDATVAAMVNTLGGATATGTGGLVRITGSTMDAPIFTSSVDMPSVTAFPGSPATGYVVIVTDDSAIGACDSAAGSARSLCWYNGSAWQSIGDGGGAGSVATDAIWDAVGDIVKGTGADTAARLARGAALTILQVNAGGTDIEWGAVTGTGSAVRAIDPVITGSLAIPQGTAPTVNALGEIALDTDLGAASNGLLIFYNGSAAAATVSFLVSDTPVAGDIPVWSASGYFTLEAAVTVPIADTQTIIKGGTDATKLLRFEVDGFTTGTTRVATPPNADFTMARIDAGQTFTGVQVMTSPDVATSVTTPSTTFALVNTTATTVNAFGATTALNLGASATMILNFGGSTTASEFRFLEPSGSGTNYSAFKAVAQGASITYSLPPTVGAAGTVLTDAAGNGVLTWAAGGAGDITAVGDCASGACSSIGSLTLVSPDVTTSLTTGSTTFALLNTTATTVNAFGAATAINIGAAATAIVNLGGSTTAAELRFLEPSGSGTNYTAFKAVAQAASITYSLPATVGGAGTFLKDAAGDGVLSWAAPAGGGDVVKVGTPVNNQVGVWTGDGTLEGDSAFTFDTATDALLVGAGSLTRVGAHVLTLTTTGTTDVTFPTTGTLQTTAGSLASNTGLPPAGVTFAASDRILCRDTASGGTGEECTAANIFTMNGTVTVAQGGSGAATLTGLVKGNGTSAFTTITAGTGVETALAANTNATDGIVTPNGTKTLTNTTLDAEGTGNSLTIVGQFAFMTGVLQGSTASGGLSCKTGLCPTATSMGGSNIPRTWVTFPDSDGEFEQVFEFQLAPDFVGVMDVRGKWRTAATSGDVVLQVQWACSADAETFNDTWSTASTTTETAKGTTLQLNDWAVTGISITGCAATETVSGRVMRQRTHASDSLTGTFDLGPFNVFLRRAQ